MTWFDLAMLLVLALSALLAFFRGFVREVLGIGAWVGAIIIAYWFFPFVSPKFEQWIQAKEFADPAAIAVVFVISLIVLSVVSSWAGALVRGSALGGVDRTLGLVFGLARGAAVLVFCYVAAGLVTTPQDWPEPIRDARLLPYVYEGAQQAVALLPAQYHPHLAAPPVNQPPSLQDLLQPQPKGSALAPPGAVGRQSASSGSGAVRRE
ncbi:MAG: CvpA family protein [Proteobacteria bacterium]|nr:CvpA family protein [Pseudomonadota bacterium]